MTSTCWEIVKKMYLCFFIIIDIDIPQLNCYLSLLHHFKIYYIHFNISKEFYSLQRNEYLMMKFSQF
jgi:hypothetical protein